MAHLAGSLIWQSAKVMVRGSSPSLMPKAMRSQKI